MIALVDCNNFYVSCERAFQPRLDKRPVVVLSNNDGCVISRSRESKELGIPMGAPFFKWRKFFHEKGVKAFSSNYELYADMSERVMETLSRFSPDIEVYSIDEAFISLEGISGPPADLGAGIRKTVRSWTGIPVSVGIGPTKVLCKVANEKAKRDPGLAGVLDLSSSSESDINSILNDFPVMDLWGIGHRTAAKLKRCGIITALELKNADPRWARREMTVTGERIVRELRGIQCVSLETVPADKKEITTSRSFGRKITNLDDLREAVSSYVSVAAAKLRGQGSLATGIYVFLMTSRFDASSCYNSAFRSFSVPTADTGQFISEAMEMVEKIYRDGRNYAKAGVILTDVSKNTAIQHDLFTSNYQDTRSSGLMRTLDDLNVKMGRGTVRYASNGIKRNWGMKRGFLSARYTSVWDDIPPVKT